METQVLPNRTVQGVLRLLARYRGVVFNLCLVVLIPLVQPWLQRRLLVGVNRNRADLTLGVLLVVLQVVELIALRWKLRAVEHRLRASSAEAKSGAPGFILWIFHLAVSAALLYPILKTFGLNPNQADDPLLGGLFLLLVSVMVIKELVILLTISPRWRSGLVARGAVSPYRELAAEGMLLVSTVFALMVLLDVSTARGSLRQADMTQFALNLVIMMIMAMLALLPLRMAFIVEEWETTRTPLDLLIWVVSIFLVLVVAIATLV